MIRVGRAAVLAAVVGLAWTGAASAADTYRLMTGPQGGVWVPLGGALKNMWEKAIPGLTVQTLPGAGIANVRGIDEGKADIGFGNSISTVDGVDGRAPFPGRDQGLPARRRSIRNTSRWWCWPNAGINSIKDLKGKSIAVQTRGNTAEADHQHILKVERASATTTSR